MNIKPGRWLTRSGEVVEIDEVTSGYASDTKQCRSWHADGRLSRLEETDFDLLFPIGEWIEHNGGPCPVPDHVLAQARLADGWVSGADKLLSTARWTHEGSNGDIVAFRVVEPNAEPQAHMMSAPGVEAEPKRRHVSDAAWGAMNPEGCGTSETRESWEQMHRRQGTMLVTVAEWDGRFQPAEGRAQLQRIAELEAADKIAHDWVREFSALNRQQRAELVTLRAVVADLHKQLRENPERRHAAGRETELERGNVDAGMATLGPLSRQLLNLPEQPVQFGRGNG